MTDTQQVEKKNTISQKQKPLVNQDWKVIFLGAAGVGKTSIINQFMYNQFSRSYETTVGVDYFTKSINVEDKSIVLQIWDTAGQEQYQSLVPSYIRSSAIAIVVYDVSNEDSFVAAKNWYEKGIEIAGNNVHFILAGNKCDLTSVASETEVDSFTKDKNIQHILISAKTGERVQELFSMAAKEASKIISEKKDAIVVEAQPVTTATDSKSGSGCC